MRSGLFAPKQGLHFWALHSLSFLLISRLHWCKHGIMAKGSPENPQICTVGHIRRCMKLGCLQARCAKWAFAPKQGLHFWALHSLSFLLISRLHWCKHGSLAKGNPENPQISTVGHIRRCMKPGCLQARCEKWAFCTETRITFLGSAFPQLPFDIKIALVQTRYLGER